MPASALAFVGQMWTKLGADRDEVQQEQRRSAIAFATNEGYKAEARDR